MKLSDFRDEKAIEVVANLLPHIEHIVTNSKNEVAASKSVSAFAQAILLNNTKDVMAIYAILDDKNPAEYHCTAATVLSDTLDMLSDPDLIALFGLQRQTAASSTSASMTGEVGEG